ncbi:mannosyl-3-phosphoglycerate phosphatase-related protein [Serratia grimesii]|uniref:mannosyl-3-phosphoglycerate phosphatase-related protein n=1 Tax=Serratia grimesii TaxID=82995 RepID=UPI00217862AF|nr:mannosyl-3-phosphoglycerate phosphatase-related protein [Serratia grimesii]CAI0851427.1 Putative mannosyl-3-phosphoglycerate phosphatase [Serratia grimesii]
MLKLSPNLLIFTDLDGSLLDHHSYRWQPAQSWLDRLARAQTPLIITTSKTAAEVCTLQQQLRLSHWPFIAENGAQIVFPEGWHNDPDYPSKTLGMDYTHLTAILHELRRQTGFAFLGFADVDDATVAQWTGLTLAQAHQARQRTGSEPLRWEGTAQQLECLRRLLEQHDLHLTQGGRFYHVMSKQISKGNAARWLAARFPLSQGFPLITLSLGDGPNDLSLLYASDLAVLIRGQQAKPLDLPGDFAGRLYRTRQQGPHGWREGLDYFLLNGSAHHE